MMRQVLFFSGLGENDDRCYKQIMLYIYDDCRKEARSFLMDMKVF